MVDGGDYADGITKTPLVIDNVRLELILTVILSSAGFRSHQGRFWW